MTAPSSDTFEISLFGPGFGESIVLHIGNGEWVIIDSCVSSSARGMTEVVPLRYLAGLGVSAHKQVSCVVATHWHNDHIRGLSKILESCEKAVFCFPGVFTRDEFLKFATAYASNDPSPLARATSEIARALEIIKERNGRFKKLGPDRLFVKSGDCEIYSLSPSDRRGLQFLEMIAEYAPVQGTTRRSVPGYRSNDVAVGMFVRAGDGISALFGADIEETPGRAWSAIVKESTLAHTIRASVYKVAHHGSSNGDYAGIWECLLLPDPLAILTPFTRQKEKLPRSADVDRILERTAKAYSSARIRSVAPDRREAVVARALRDSEWKIRRNDAKLGQVRLRRKIGDAVTDWQVELFDNAVKLSEIHK